MNYNWSILSKLGQNKIVQKTYIYLVAVPFLINTLKKFNLEKVIESIPFSWQMFFLSALMFTCGSILFNIFAPKIIKENESYRDFENHGKNWQHLTSYALNIGIDFAKFQDVWSKQNENLKKVNEKYLQDFLKKNEKDRKNFEFIINYQRDYIHTTPMSYNLDDPQGELKSLEIYNSSYDRNNRKNLSRSFWNIYNEADKNRQYIRVICMIFFLVGLIAIGIVILNSILIVFNLEYWTILKL